MTVPGWHGWYGGDQSSTTRRGSIEESFLSRTQKSFHAGTDVLATVPGQKKWDGAGRVRAGQDGSDTDQKKWDRMGQHWMVCK